MPALGKPALSVLAALVCLMLVAIPLPTAVQGATEPPLRALTSEAAPRPVFTRLWLWVLEGQREMTNGMTAAVRQLKSGDFLTSAAVLAAISFLYGVLHAVGPGHGKFVISSYALANERTVRRGILLSFMAAFVQALSAILIVGLLAVALKATSLQIRAAEVWLETASWGLIAMLGAWLLYGRIRTLLASRRTEPGDARGHGCGPAGAEGHHHEHDHVHTHAADGPCCGHAHAPDPTRLGEHWHWPRAWSLALSIGVRPCTGAIGVLIFALGIGIFWAGVLATFAMSIGTALTVSALASMAVGSRELAMKVAGSGSLWAGRIQTAAGLAGAALVLLLGASFFLASLGGSGPL